MNFSLPSCARSTISAAVMVLEFEAIRKWVLGIWRCLLAQLRRAHRRGIAALRRANHHDRTGDEHLLGRLLHHGLKRCLIDGFECRCS